MLSQTDKAAFEYLLNKYGISASELTLLLDFHLSILKQNLITPLAERPLAQRQPGVEVTFYSDRDMSEYKIEFKRLSLRDWYGLSAGQSNTPISQSEAIAGHSSVGWTCAIVAYRNRELIFARKTNAENCRKLLGKIKQLENEPFGSISAKQKVKVKEMMSVA
jgi:hypothetical protein